MNLKHLVAAQKALMAQRGAEAENLCRQAYHLIVEAEALGFTDKSLLKQAMHLFLEVLRQYPGFADACLGLAYLAMLLEQNTVASRYLRLVLDTQPEHPEALRLHYFLNADDPYVAGHPSQRSGGDQLYDQVAQEVFMFQRYWTRQGRWQVDDRPQTREALLTLKTQLTEQLTHFDLQLNLLEAEFETHAFRLHLRLGEEVQENLSQALRTSEEMAVLGQELQALHHLLQDLHRAIATGQAEDFEVQLEAMNDALERAQRQIQLFAEAGADTQRLDYALDIASALLEQAQENLDAR